MDRAVDQTGTMVSSKNVACRLASSHSTPIFRSFSSYSTGWYRRGGVQSYRDVRRLGGRRNTLLYDMSCLTTANISSCLAL